jgi:general secretion pathway protein D
MKTTLPILLLLLLVSCAQRQKSGQAAAPASTTVVTAEPLFEDVYPPAETPTATVPPSTEPAPAAVPTEPPVADATPSQPAAQVVPDVQAPRIPTPAPTLSLTAADPSAEEIIPAGLIDFRNMPLEQALTFYSELVNRTLLRPAGLPTSQITLTTRTALTKREAIQALDSVLGLNGIAMINVGEKFVKAVAQAQAVQEGATPDTRLADELPEFGSFLTHVVQLKYIKPTEIVPALQPFAKMNSILPIDSSQILVLRDYTENIKRMLEMIDRVDIVVPGEFVSEVIPIKYAKAAEIADALNSLSGGGGGSTSVGRAAGASTRTPAGGVGARPGAAGYTPGAVGQPGATGVGGAAGAGSSFTDNLRRIVQRASTSGDLEILGKTKMIADERSNSLLIFASRADMEMIKSVVEKLDVVLAQVLIETVIMDVNMDDTLAYGVSAGQHAKTGSSGAVGGAYNNSGGLGTLNEFFSEGLSNAFPQSSGLTYFGRYKGDLDVAVTAAATDSRVNVVQKPRILTSHATPGTIFVGSTVPYLTSTYYGGGFGGGPSSSYQQLQVGIGLSVTPFINPEGLVVMQIDETIDEVSGSIPITGVGNVPTTTSRKISAEVAVNDGDTIILGGFIRNSSTKNNSGVPLLKDIPLLGALFRSSSDTKARNELIVLMRPTVLKTPEIAALATVQEKNRLPGVSAAEAEVEELEKAALEKERKRAARAEELRRRENSR